MNTARTGYQLPAETRIGTVRLQVADLGRSLEWYQRVLGLRVLSQGPGTAALGPLGGDTALLELREHPGALPPPRRGRLGLFHYAILVPDRAALGRFLAHQVKQRTPIGASDHLVSEAIYLSDPDGLGIEVYRDRPRAEWPYVNGQLAMDTLPLDGDGVLQAAGGYEWEGMPAGTTIGHMHLHVGDIATAARFYQQGLGLDVTVSGYPGALFLSAGGYHHHLGVNTWAGPAATPPRESDARLVEWELLLPKKEELGAVSTSLTGAGATPEMTDRGLVVRDPWGAQLVIRAVV